MGHRKGGKQMEQRLKKQGDEHTWKTKGQKMCLLKKKLWFECEGQQDI